MAKKSEAKSQKTSPKSKTQSEPNVSVAKLKGSINFEDIHFNNVTDQIFSQERNGSKIYIVVEFGISKMMSSDKEVKHEPELTKEYLEYISAKRGITLPSIPAPVLDTKIETEVKEKETETETEEEEEETEEEEDEETEE